MRLGQHRDAVDEGVQGRRPEARLVAVLDQGLVDVRRQFVGKRWVLRSSIRASTSARTAPTPNRGGEGAWYCATPICRRPIQLNWPSGVACTVGAGVVRAT